MGSFDTLEDKTMIQTDRQTRRLNKTPSLTGEDFDEPSRDGEFTENDDIILVLYICLMYIVAKINYVSLLTIIGKRCTKKSRCGDHIKQYIRRLFR